MLQNLTASLASLRDLEGIVGSFVVGEEGELLAKDLPAYFDGVLEEVGPRLIRLRDAFDLAEGDVSSCAVRFKSHRLTIRSVEGALLAVIADSKINGPALRMAMNLVLKKCTPEELTSSRSSYLPPPPSYQQAPLPPSSATLPTATSTPNSAHATLPSHPGRDPAPSSPDSPRKKREIFFRGKRVS